MLIFWIIIGIIAGLALLGFIAIIYGVWYIDHAYQDLEDLVIGEIIEYEEEETNNQTESH